MKIILIASTLLICATVNVMAQSMQEFWCKLAVDVLPPGEITKKNALFFGTAVADQDQTGTIQFLKKNFWGTIVRGTPYLTDPALIARALDQTSGTTAPLSYSLTLKKGFSIGTNLDLVKTTADANVALTEDLAIFRNSSIWL